MRFGLALGGDDGCGEDGDPFIALAGEIRESRGFDDARFGEQFQPVEGLLAFADGDLERGYKMPARGCPECFPVVGADGCAGSEDLPPEHIGRARVRKCRGKFDHAHGKLFRPVPQFV